MENKNLKYIDKLINIALKEDLKREDITCKLFIPKDLKVKALIYSKDEGVICGLEIAKMVFKKLDRKISFKKFVKDGDEIKKGQKIALVEGNARKILAGERTALNFLQHLSGVATLTKKYSKIAKKFKVKIFDTRKTIPGLRILQKYAVRVGGGKNHRFSLSDQILIKTNHIRAVGIEEIVKRMKNTKKKIEIEVSNLKELKQVLKAKPEIVMLDNFKIPEIKKAIKLIKNKCEIEVSGKVNLKNFKNIAKLKINRISIGQITHSAKALDLALRIISKA